jgi:putative multiple sugar transport system substrate-binding protein
MKRKLLSALLSMSLAASLLAGCAAAPASAPAADTAAPAAEAATDEAAPAAEAAGGAGGKVGVSMPTKDLQRWNQDGDNMKSQLEAAGYEVDLQYASNDVQTQLSQVENMISSGCDVLAIAAIEGSSLGEALDMAKEAGIPVIAYDRLLMDSDAVSYYATFDNYMVGTVQGNYIVEALDLDNAEGPFNLEITAGDPGDNNAGYFFNGAYDVLKPYIDEGKLVVVSGQNTFEQCATPTWATETAQSRAENILSSYYADGTNVDVWLCSNDSTALGVENALAANYNGTYPIITGQDCDIENTKNMIAGKQAMSVFKDTRTLASQVVKMIGQILNGEEVDVNDTETYNNNVITVPSYLCEPVFADVNNYKELLIDSGYYTEDQLQ